MASALYGELAQAAVDLLNELGQIVLLTRSAAGSGYDPDQGVVEDGGEQVWSANGVEFEYAQREVDGSLIQSGDRRVLIAPNLGTMPQSGDVVTLGAYRLEVVESRPLQPAGVVVLHEVQARGT
jgi:hypothetical protein